MKRISSVAVQFLIGFLLILSTLSVSGQRKIPPFEGVWVQDEAGVLSPQVKSQLEQALKNHRDSTSTQIAVYVIKSLEGEDVNDYSYKVAKEWKLGQESKDNGVLLLIAVEDRKLKIEVGLGLEGALTDLESKHITRNVIVPQLKTGNYDGAVTLGVAAIIQGVAGEYVNDAPRSIRKKSRRSPLLTLLIIGLVILALSRRNRGGGGGYWSSGGGWIGPIGGFGGSSGGGGGWSSGPDFGGGGSFGGGGASDSW